MLYIVQMIAPGTAAPPRIFADQAAAQATFIALLGEHRAADFAQYCATNEADPESFTTAREFAAACGEDDVRPCYWELTLEADEVAAKQAQLPPQSREPVLKAAAEAQQQVLGVQTDLRGLAEKLTGMSQELIRLQNLLGDEGEGFGPDETPAAPELPEPVPDELEEKYQTAEWQDFVQSLIQMCGGNWAEFPLLSRQDWRQAVYSDQTKLPYWEWIAITIDQAIEKAREHGYAVEEDGEQSGHFAYLTPAGERSSTLYELEDLAWCAAGLHEMETVSKQT